MGTRTREFWQERPVERPLRVTDNEWAAFCAYIWDGKTYKQVANDMGVPASRAWTMIDRVMRFASPQLDAGKRCPCCNGTGRIRASVDVTTE